MIGPSRSGGRQVGHRHECQQEPRHAGRPRNPQHQTLSSMNRKLAETIGTQELLPTCPIDVSGAFWNSRSSVASPNLHEALSCQGEAGGEFVRSQRHDWRRAHNLSSGTPLTYQLQAKTSLPQWKRGSVSVRICACAIAKLLSIARRKSPWH